MILMSGVTQSDVTFHYVIQKVEAMNIKINICCKIGLILGSVL